MKPAHSKNLPQILICLALTLVFGLPATRTGFNSDDIMNIHNAWCFTYQELLLDNVLYWPAKVRPLCSLILKILYEIFGFNVAPFHVFCFALVLVNLVLTFNLLRLISNSGAVAFAATAMLAFHGSLWDIYASSGTIYDIVCQFFLLLALSYYFNIRSRGYIPGVRETAFLAAAGICAINAKEMGVVLPALMGAYELVFHPPPRRWRDFRVWLAQEVRTPLILAIPVCMLMAGRFFLENELTGHPAYAIELSLPRYALTTLRYLELAAFDTLSFTPVTAFAMLAGVLIWVLLSRSRTGLYGWLYFNIALLPLSFATPRTGFVLYIPLTGAALLLGVALVKAGKALAGSLRIETRVDSILWRNLVLLGFTAIVGLSDYLQLRYILRHRIEPGLQQAIRATASDLIQIEPNLNRSAQVLLINDPFDKDFHLPLMTMRLAYRDSTLGLERLALPDASQLDPLKCFTFPLVAQYDGERYYKVRCGAAPPGSYDDTGPIEFSGSWIRDSQFQQTAGGTLTYSRVPGNEFSFRFRGSGISWVFTRAPNRGTAAVSIDGISKGLIDLYAEHTEWRSLLTYTNLHEGEHTFLVQVQEKTNSAASDSYVDVDQMIVHGP